MVDVIILVFVGGAFGAMLREFVMLMVPPLSDGFPLDILVANVVAAFLLGLVTALHAKKIHSNQVHTMTGTGIMGGLSTFSSFAYGSVVLMSASMASALVAIVYVVVSVVLGYVAVVVGMRIGKRSGDTLLRHPAMASEVFKMESGLQTIASRHPVAETIDRLVEKATALGMHIFARVDHGAGASEAGMPLRPTELLIFGNPKGGTALIQDHQTAGIDLPIKALAWEDERGKVWLTFNDPAWLAQRHGLGTSSADAVRAIAERGSAVAHFAAGE